MTLEHLGYRIAVFVLATIVALLSYRLFSAHKPILAALSFALYCGLIYRAYGKPE